MKDLLKEEENMKNKKLAIIGATGLVGQTVLKVLEEKNIPNFEYELLHLKSHKAKKLDS